MSAPRPGNKNATTQHPPALWWESLDEECPITLEPLASLPYPPFELGASNCYFDGVALASYMVSRGVFDNPLTREPLKYSDCKRLDDYVKTYHPQDTRMAVCCEAFMLSQSVKIESSTSDTDRRARVLRSEAAAALCHLFVYGRNSNNSNNSARPQSVARNEPQAPSTFHLYNRPTRTAVDAMDGLRIIDDDEERIVQVEQQEWRQVQQSFPPLNDNGAPVTAVSVDKHLLSTVKKMSAQTRQEDAQRRILLQEAQRRMIQEARKRQEERIRERQRVKTVRQQEHTLERLEQNELERARAEIEQWRKEHWDRLLRESEATQTETKKLVSDQLKGMQDGDSETEENDAADSEIKLGEEERRQEQTARKKAKAAAKRKRAKERKKEEKEMERKEAEKRQQEQLLAEKKAASAKKCAACGEGILGFGFDKFGHCFCSTKCARAGPTHSMN